MPRLSHYRLPYRVAALSLLWLLSTSLAHAKDIPNVPSGSYIMDPAHTSVSFGVSHLGFSIYTGRFDLFEGQLEFKSEALEQSHLDVTIYPNSIDTNNPTLEEDLRTEHWFNTIKYKTASFHVTAIERTGPTTGKITGDFTLLGITHKLILDTILVGAGTQPLSGKHVIGFSATGLLHRSDYGLTNLLPMIGDDVTLHIETEFDQID